MGIILVIITVVAALALTVAAASYIVDKVGEELCMWGNQSKSKRIMIISMGVSCFCLMLLMIVFVVLVVIGLIGVTIGVS